MANLIITGQNKREEKHRSDILQNINNQLNLKELERLGKIAESKKARQYLNAKFITLKTFLKL
jgi:hypothetical protein